MSETSRVERVLAEHQMRATLSDACTCGTPDIGTLMETGEAMRAHRAHVAAAVLDFLRSVAADEGMQHNVARAIRSAYWCDVTQGEIDETADGSGVTDWCPEADAALAAFLDVLGAGDE